MDSFKHIYVYAVPSTLLSSLKAISSARTEKDLEDDFLHDLPSEADDSDVDEDQDSPPKTGELPQGAEQDISNLYISAGSPINWYLSKQLPTNGKLGIYKSILRHKEDDIQSIQLQGETPRTLAMFMVGGGHFSGAIISLTESTVSKCVIKASKGFHRYTTRKKQGGSQSANDNAKGAANSAGAQIRRYNEIALQEDIRALLKEWKSMLEDVEIILVRASGQSSRKLLYDNGLKKDDARIRGFPLNTRRATQAEIVRCFHILTRLQVGSTEDDVVESKPVKKDPVQKPPRPEVETADPLAVAQTERLISLIRRNKVPAVKSCIDDEKIQVSQFVLVPRKTYLHTPTLLHYASSSDSGPIISALLDMGADPTILNETGKTAFEVAGSRSTRDAFRIWRGTEANRNAWDWDAARIPVGLTLEQLQQRQAKEQQEKAVEDAIEEQRRQAELLRLEEAAEEARVKEKAEQDRRRGPGRSLAAGVLGQSSSTSLDGLTPEMKTKIERERRARAAEARFAKK